MRPLYSSGGIHVWKHTLETLTPNGRALLQVVLFHMATFPLTLLSKVTEVTSLVSCHISHSQLSSTKLTSHCTHAHFNTRPSVTIFNISQTHGISICNNRGVNFLDRWSINIPRPIMSRFICPSPTPYPNLLQLPIVHIIRNFMVKHMLEV